MKILIDIPDELKQKIDEGFINQVITNKLWEATRNATPEEPGYWTILDADDDMYRWASICSNCSEITFNAYTIGSEVSDQFCPKCGKKMDLSNTIDTRRNKG